MWAFFLVLALYLAIVGVVAVFLAVTNRATPEEAFWRASGLPRLLPWLRKAVLRGAVAARRRIVARQEARRLRLEQERAAQQALAEQARERKILQETLVYRSINADSSLPEGYRILGADSVRDNAVDPWIKRRYRAVIFDVFGNRCVACGIQTDLHLDHFWRPKVRGGNFAMRHDSGPVANVIPLCKSCNASKGDADAREYFEQGKLEALADQTRQLTARFRQDEELRARMY